MKVIGHYGTIWNAFEDAIRVRTDSPICHVQIGFSDGQSFSAETSGTCFVASPAATDTDWIQLELGVSAAEEALCRAWCEKNKGLPYDWEGVFGLAFDEFVKQVGPSAAHAYFCSALVITILQLIGWFMFAVADQIFPGEVVLMTMARLEAKAASLLTKI